MGKSFPLISGKSLFKVIRKNRDVHLRSRDRNREIAGTDCDMRGLYRQESEMEMLHLQVYCESFMRNECKDGPDKV